MMFSYSSHGIYVERYVRASGIDHLRKCTQLPEKKEVYTTMLQKCLVTKLMKGLGPDVAIGKDNYAEAWSHHYIRKILLEVCFLFQCVLS
jgi:hypothetical protein